MAGRPVDVIQLEPHDDVVSVRDRLAFIESRRVLLVWPPAGRVLHRKLDLVLLQREVRRRAARMALVTHDMEVIHNADDLDISTFFDMEDSQHQRWKRGRIKVFIDRSDKPARDPDPDDLRDAASRLRVEATPSQMTLRKALGAALLLVLVCGVLGAGYLFLPSATLTLMPAHEHLDVTIRVVADPSAQDVDLANHIAPATYLRVEVEESAEVDTTGSQTTAATLAQGNIIFTNLTNQAVTIPAGTLVSTSIGTVVRFRTQEAVNIAGQEGAIAVVPIEALAEFAGQPGNIPAYGIDRIEGPLAEILTAQNYDATDGGGVPTNQVVSQADQDRLLAAVRQAIQQRALGDLTPLLGETQDIIAESIRISEERPEWTVFSAPVGTAADSISLTMRATVEAVVVNQRMVNQVAFAGLTERIPAGQVVIPDSMAFSRGAVEAIEAGGRITFLANVSSDVAQDVNADQLRQALAGRSRDQTIVYLYQNLDLAPDASPGIIIWPEFFGRMPLLPSRITIILRDAS